MKRYRKSVSIGGLLSANANAPIYFTYESQNDPSTQEKLALVYDRTGAYLGWTTIANVRKYIYGQLYYKTKGAYAINLNLRSSRDRKYIIEKASGKVALVIRYKFVNTDELLDPEAPGAKAQETLNRFRVVDYNTLWNGVYDPYKLVENINDEMRKETHALAEKYTQRIKESLQSQIKGEGDLLDLAELMVSRDEAKSA